MKDLFKAGLFRLLFLGFNFLIGLFIAAMSGTELFGTISLMIVNAALFHLLTGFGADQSIVWHGASNKLSPQKLFTITFTTSLFQIIIFTLIAYSFYYLSGKTLLSKGNSTGYLYLELIYFTGLVFLDKYVSLLYAQNKARVCNIILTGITFIATLFLLLFHFNYLGNKPDPLAFFCFLTLIQALSVIVLYHFLQRVSFSEIKREELSSFFRFSGLVFITNLIQFLAYRSDYWFIDYFESTDQVGIYSQANKFAGLLWIVPNIIAALLIPALSSPNSNIREKELAGIGRVFNFLNVFIVGLMVTASFLIYTYFLQEDYFEGFIPLLYMLPGYFFFCITIILAAYFSAKNLLWVNLAGSSICLIAIVIADLLLIPSYGITGAAWSNTIAYSTSTLFTIIMFIRFSKLKPGALFYLRKSDWKLITKLQS